jgi:glycosyltransferase involved in cell wall biosynthesis
MLPQEVDALQVDPAKGRALTVMVPAYNEGETIADTVRNLREGTRSLVDQGFTVKIYVINDGSEDDTGRLAAEAGADRVVNHKVNRGLGAAIRTALAAARDDGADIAVKFDADLQHDPADITALIAPILADDADIVYGNRFDRIEYKMPFVRRTGNFVFTRLMAWLTGWKVKDSQPGILAVNRAYLNNFYMPGDYNYTQQILLDAYHKGMRFAHVSVAFRERAAGRSFVSFRYPFKVLPQIVMVLVGVRPLRVFAPIGLLFVLLAFGIGAYDFADWLFADATKPILHVNIVLGSFLFGVQTLFFGLLSDLIVKQKQI